MTNAQTTDLGIARGRYVDYGSHFPVSLSCFIQDQDAFYASSATPLPFSLADMQTVVIANPSLFPQSAYQVRCQPMYFSCKDRIS
jgi:hypothetical protein